MQKKAAFISYALAVRLAFAMLSADKLNKIYFKRNDHQILVSFDNNEIYRILIYYRINNVSLIAKDKGFSYTKAFEALLAESLEEDKGSDKEFVKALMVIEVILNNNLNPSEATTFEV